MLRQITELKEFTSMDIDIFETEDGRFLINELQTVFGCSSPEIQMKIDDVPGRYIHTATGWQFEKGDFFANHMCNHRIEYLINKLNSPQLKKHAH